MKIESETSDELLSLGVSPKEAADILWYKGNLLWKLDSNQLEMVDSFKNNNAKVTVWSCSRQLGKTYTLCAVAIMECLQKKNVIVKFAAPTQKMIKTIIRPVMRQILADCPEDIRPVEKIAEGFWYFPSTGSQIQVAGCDSGRAENLRGTSGTLCIVDEAGFVSSELEYIVNSILLPLTTVTHGKIILASTPPKSQAHDFVKFINRARIHKSLTHKTIFDNPRLTRADIDELADAAGGYESINFKREYLAQIIKDDKLAIVPEFDDVLKAKIVKEWPRPPFYDTYAAMDVGMKDLTVVLFAYFDFKANKLIIEDEFVINGQKLTTDVLAQGIRDKESKNFSNPYTGEKTEPYKRVSDNNNLILLQDLYKLHDLLFHASKKDDADAALNNMRLLLKDEHIIINPRCVTLITHLESGIYNKAKTSFSRDAENGHFDAIDSLKYLVRNVDFHKNPFPIGWGMVNQSNVFQTRKTNSTANSAWLRIINAKPKS